MTSGRSTVLPATLGFPILVALLVTSLASLNASANPVVTPMPGSYACLMLPVTLPLIFVIFGGLLCLMLRLRGLDIGTLPTDTKKFMGKVVKAIVIISLFTALIDEFMILAMDIEVVPSVESYPAIFGTLLIAASAIGTSAGYMRLKTIPSVAMGVAIAALNPVAWVATDDFESVGIVFLVFAYGSILLSPFVFVLLKDAHAKTCKPQVERKSVSPGNAS